MNRLPRLPALPTRWPLLVIGAAAGTSTWSGWVGLGALTGFGVVQPFPGIADDVKLNTAITLPIGVEAYAVYALSIATGTAPLTPTARKYAWSSAAGALALGMLGQAAYHLMNAQHIASAPWLVVVAVSCLPVLVLGAASLLWHLAAKPVEIEPAGAKEKTPAAEAADSPVEEEQPDAPDTQPVTIPDEALVAIIAEQLAAKPGVGFPTLEKAIREAGWLVGNTERVKNALRDAKNPGLHVVRAAAGGE